MDNGLNELRSVSFQYFSTFRMSHGKIVFTKCTDKWVEGNFYWPFQAGCSENDQHMILDLFLLWSSLDLESIKDLSVWNNILSNMTRLSTIWLSIRNNPWAQEKVKHFSTYFLGAVLHVIWSSGFNIEIMRQYYPIITKAAADIEAITRSGFKKLIATKVVIIPALMEIDGIVRKRPERFLAVKIILLNRQLARINDFKEFLQIKEQMQHKEMMYSFNFEFLL